MKKIYVFLRLFIDLKNSLLVINKNLHGSKKEKN